MLVTGTCPVWRTLLDQKYSRDAPPSWAEMRQLDSLWILLSLFSQSWKGADEEKTKRNARGAYKKIKAKYRCPDKFTVQCENSAVACWVRKMEWYEGFIVPMLFSRVMSPVLPDTLKATTLGYASSMVLTAGFQSAEDTSQNRKSLFDNVCLLICALAARLNEELQDQHKEDLLQTCY